MQVQRGDPLRYYHGLYRTCPLCKESGFKLAELDLHYHLLREHRLDIDCWREAVLRAALSPVESDLRFECGPCLRAGEEYWVGLDQRSYDHMWTAHSGFLTPLDLPEHIEDIGGWRLHGWLRQRELSLSLLHCLGPAVHSLAFPPCPEEETARRSMVEEFDLLDNWTSEHFSDQEVNVIVLGLPDEGVDMWF